MVVLGSTQYVDLKVQKEGWYQLSVINQWDFKSKAVCFSQMRNGLLVYYSLQYNTPTSSGSYISTEVINITPEMKEAIITAGYLLL
jgi:hypothetical protein